MARNSLQLQPVCTTLFSCHHCLAPLTRHSPCKPSLHLFQSCFLLECESPYHILCPEGNNNILYNCVRASLPSVNSVFPEACFPFLWMAEDLFIVYFNSLFDNLSHWFGKFCLNPIHLDVHTTAIFAAQHCLLFVTPKNFYVVFFPSYSGLECFPRFFFLLLSIYIQDSFFFLPLIRYFLSSLHLQSR